MYRVLLFFVAGCMLAGCGSRDAEYYVKHPDEMKKKWAECARMSAAEVMGDRECAVVSQADSKRFFGERRPKPVPRNTREPVRLNQRGE
jgi:hypothetical protein